MTRQGRSQTLVLLGLLLWGCSDPRRDVPGHVRPGSVDAVTRRVTGADPDRIMDLGLVPLDGYVPPTVPLVEAPQVISIWFFPRHSYDGRSEREGHWVHTQIGLPRFYRDQALHDLRIPLSALHDIQIGPDGQPYVVQQRPVAGQQRRVSRPIADDVPVLPWRPSSEEHIRTTVIVEQASGARSTVRQQDTPTSAVMNPDGTPNQAAIDRMVEDVNRRLRDSRGAAADE